MSNHTRLSKFLSLILRHRAADFGVELDEQGFAAVEAVWAQVQHRFGEAYRYEDFLAVAEGRDSEKQRFEIAGDRIRARYGHSAVRTVTYDPVTPPEMLYHGTTRRALRAIRSQGLRPQKRQYVHLSCDPEWAGRVGHRHDQQPVVLRIRAGEMAAAGHEFYHPEPNHYLTAAVPAAFIDFPD